QFDDIDTGVSQLLDLGASVRRALHSPTKSFRSRIRLMLNERSGDVKSRAGNFAAINPVAHLDAFLERRSEIACAGHPGHEQLMRGSRHDFAPEPLRI